MRTCSLLFVLLLSGVATAQSTPVERSSLVQASASSDGFPGPNPSDDQSFSTATFAPFNETAIASTPAAGASATQNSSVTASGASFSLGAGGNVGPSGINGAATSTLLYKFAVAPGTGVQLTGTLNVTGLTPPPTPTGSTASITLSSDIATLFTLTRSIDTGSATPFVFNDVLPAGIYTLSVSAVSNTSVFQLTSNAATVNGTLTVIPEPTSLAALALLLAAPRRR